MPTIQINNEILNFTELINTPIIVSNLANHSEIIHINKSGKELINEVFNSVDEFVEQVANFSGIFRKRI